MDDIRGPLPDKPVRLMDQLRAEIRHRGLSFRTEKTYLYWVRAFIRFHKRRHPKEMGATEIDQYLSHLAEKRRVSVGTQRIALNAIVFLYRKFLKQDPGKLRFTYARRQRRAPVVFSHTEAMQVINHLDDPYKLMTELLYGSGLRMNECLRLRVKDLDFAQLQLCVRDGKGSKDRHTLLPESLATRLHNQINTVSSLHEYDLVRGFGEVYMPDALARKYPNAAKSLSWQFLFPGSRVGVDPYTGVKRRHHLHDTAFSRQLKKAIKKAGILKRASSHTFRHSFATRLLENGYDLKLIQSLLGHSDIRITEIYLHVVRNRAGAIKGPLDMRTEIREPAGIYQNSYQPLARVS